ncbi:PREDICTED: MAM and LDL-receptor class A domain-containing protein 1-like [Branchiostoma belcheri]|uniref:MAM and LDL-receptor class A domain-containing protein 1-like n=1 Tax=Branchiostoma belcheri TaxID=7741 RepID=A0A6P5AW44_BRABE|nr:PREDICTED: MAM and LDL-receptor class A domain-containing protein 1-like [Branchiostoma belcheri]
METSRWMTSLLWTIAAHLAHLTVTLSWACVDGDRLTTTTSTGADTVDRLLPPAPGRVLITPLEIVFEASRGSGYYGDISLDDISIVDNSCRPDPFDCDFELGLCGWRQAYDDNFDWSRRSGSTPSTSTGPSADHTTGGGYYIYIETSSGSSGSVARVISPLVTTTSAKCVQFWYHMYGRDVNRLRVYIKTGSSLGNPVWTRTGTQGNQWRFGQVDIPAGTSFNIVFEARRGSGPFGDISLDDISIVDNSCSPGTFNCDFELGLCGWRQAHDDNFDWSRHSGSTPSDDTGPSADHTTGSGYYIYIETSSGSSGSVARVISPLVTTTSAKCVQFWYHMYGRDVNRLKVYIKTGSSLGNPVWTRTGTQGNQWRFGQVDIPAGTSFNIVFEASRGSGNYGDISLDDISIVDRVVTHDPFNCDFELGLCGWRQAHDDNFDWSRHSGSTPSDDTGPSADHTTGSKYYSQSQWSKAG